LHRGLNVRAGHLNAWHGNGISRGARTSNVPTIVSVQRSAGFDCIGRHIFGWLRPRLDRGE